MNKKFNRRNFIGTTAVAAAGFSIVPSHAVSGMGHIAPSDKLNIAGIGIGSKGAVNLKNMPGQNMVAMCDVDWSYADPVFKTYPKATKWKDYREMLEKQKDIDAVVIATPDHTHALPAAAAMQLGKHVYLQKPLTHSVWESRYLTKLAKETGVVTQMGNEGHSKDTVYEVAEVVHSGCLGEIREAHVWTNRPIWRQGMPKPLKEEKVPDTLDWDLFIGPAKMRAYNAEYHPWIWRGWWDFGTGALGDMGCHLLDVPNYALQLGAPIAFQASSSLVNTESAPVSAKVSYLFPARKNLPYCALPELELTWYDGGLMPARPFHLPVNAPMNPGGGFMFIGSKAILIAEAYGDKWKVYQNGEEIVPETKVTLERISDDPNGGGRHEMHFVNCCKNGGKPASCFEYAGPFNEMVVMGNLAVRMQSLQKTLLWDAENMKVTNIAPDETLRTTELFPFTSDVVTQSVESESKKMVKWNAQEMCAEWIKHTYRNGWSL
ncbi:Gfo/Idh/MocA family oxidoreductase [Maribellus sp. YY47]|uniref:Gfo/Idh/MocA family protein n=1 Tax=Maribellus sp. YY47 TaxID=2929486 RepID=UPI00200091DA|nr:Gfo/Idh/MocA family oxidoreductase [Maribellus sp. YY47]MCK3684219.1 Gfo/Idh/MocA family oxidoreductase [Maribellus sp. YY47]